MLCARTPALRGLEAVGNLACPAMLGQLRVSQCTLGHPGPASPCFFSQPQASGFSGLLYPLQVPFPRLPWILSSVGHVGAARRREERGGIQTDCGGAVWRGQCSPQWWYQSGR